MPSDFGIPSAEVSKLEFQIWPGPTPRLFLHYWHDTRPAWPAGGGGFLPTYWGKNIWNNCFFFFFWGGMAMEWLLSRFVSCPLFFFFGWGCLVRNFLVLAVRCWEHVFFLQPWRRPPGEAYDFLAPNKFAAERNRGAERPWYRFLMAVESWVLGG